MQNGTAIFGLNIGLIGAIALLISPFVDQQAWAADKPLYVVPSSDNSYFKQTIATLTKHVDSSTELQVVSLNALETGALDLHPDALIVTLGLPATKAIAALGKSKQLISAYMTLEQYHALNNDNLQAILLDQPLSRYLAFSKYLINANTVGLIDSQPIRFNASETRLLENLSMSISQLQISGNRKLLPTLRNLLQNNDSLLMLPRQAIYNRDSLKGVLLTSYRQRKPAISYSPAHVKSGALAALFSSPVDIGRHLSIAIHRRLPDTSKKPPKFEFAKFFSIATNPRVARALGLKLPNDNELRRKLDRISP